MKYCKILTMGLAAVMAAGCSDFFEAESDHVVYAGETMLSGSGDTIYSMIGVLNKLQAIADRTILLGEARGDLVDVTNNTDADLRQVAMFEVDNDNMYNVPRDYYAIINNCNYYISKADIDLKNNRNEYLFRKEYAAVKAIRAWTYLQLVTTYGRVPFVTEPILTKADAEKEYPVLDIQGVCNYFINEDGLQEWVNEPFPGYANIKGLPSKLFYFPVDLVLGDLHLWAGEGHYLEAAKHYYHFITNRTTKNGVVMAYGTGTNAAYWQNTSWQLRSSSSLYSSYFNEGDGAELITMIPGDSVPSEGYYSQLRNLFNSREENNYSVSLVPSQGMIDLSASMVYAYMDPTMSITYAPAGMEDYQSGDLRLSTCWSMSKNVVIGKNSYDFQSIAKYQTRNVHIYRRQLVYLRLAEAMNRAGYPAFAYAVLAYGLTNSTIDRYVHWEYRNPADSLVLAQFDFPSGEGETQYLSGSFAYNNGNFVGFGGNTLGIHSRGCGVTPLNEFYQLPFDSVLFKADSVAHVEWQKQVVEDMIVDEQALEMAFEGYRFYDLMRVALRRNDPAYLANRVNARRGEGKDAGFSTNLMDVKNWYLHWQSGNDKIGY